ncbi:MAG: hypothetical protein Q8P31_08360 [Bacillota bacterium]|nr:hypothetical protein [Bacillota bacterium]
MTNADFVPMARLCLTGVAVLATAAGALAAGVTTGGLVARTALAGVCFWILGTVLGRLIAWCGAPASKRGPALPGSKGQVLDVTLPATHPPGV